MKQSYYTIFRSQKSNEYYFNLVAPNGKIILQSEGYKTRNGVLKAIGAVKKYAVISKLKIL